MFKEKAKIFIFYLNDLLYKFYIKSFAIYRFFCNIDQAKMDIPNNLTIFDYMAKNKFCPMITLVTENFGANQTGFDLIFKKLYWLRKAFYNTMQ